MTWASTRYVNGPYMRRTFKAVFRIAKAHLNYTSMKILGHSLTSGGRLPDPGLVATIMDLSIPTTLEGVRSLLGLAQVVREYVPAMSTIIAPIQLMTKKGTNIVEAWGQEQNEAFSLLKKILTSPPVLAPPDLTKPFRVEVDACKTGRGIGGVLLQQDSKKTNSWHVIAYYSRALSDAERNYSATELECTALHDTILHWHCYLANGPFTVIVDHYALVYMVTKAGGAEQHQRLLRLCLDLQEYCFEVVHRQGKKHIMADAVSRLLQKDEQPYVRTADELRNDFEPLRESEINHLRERYPSDFIFMADTISTYRQDQRLAIQSIRVQLMADIISTSTSSIQESEIQLHNLQLHNSSPIHSIPDTSMDHSLLYDRCSCHSCDQSDKCYQDIYQKMLM